MRHIRSISRLLFILSVFCLVRPGGGFAAEKVSLALDWIPIGKHAPFYAALDRGLYREKSMPS